MRIPVHDWVTPLGALEPRQAEQLARHIINQKDLAGKILLDFSGVGTVSSGFANALFIALADATPLNAWRAILDFEGIDGSKGEVIAKSLRAVRKALPTVRESNG